MPAPEDPPPDLPLDAVRQALHAAEEHLALRQRVLRLPGVQAAVALRGELLLDTAHGHADIERGVPLTSRHLVRIASHSKTFTAVALLQLAEAGRVRLDDRLGQHVHDLPAEVASVTLREVLGHGAGLSRDGADGDHWTLERPFPTREELAASLSASTAVLPPGERFKYSNVGYALLGQVIEAVTGASYAAHVRSAVIDPIGLTDTGPELDADRVGDYARGYTSLTYDDRRHPIEHVDTRAMVAATGFSSTAADVARYATALAWGDGRLVSDASRRLAFREEHEVEGADEHYGLGFEVVRVGDRTYVGHGGGYPGHATKTLLEPTLGLAVCVAVTCIDGPAAELALAVARLLGLALEHGSEPPDDATRARLDRFTGATADLWVRTDVVRLGGQLVSLRLDQADPTRAAVLLGVVDDTTLRVTGGGTGFGSYGETVRYAFARDGSVETVRGASSTTGRPLPALRERLARGDGVVHAP